MASHRYAAVMVQIYKHEGGYVDHPRDPGGATNMGITHITLSRWRGKPVTKQDVRNLTKAEADEIYRANYWNPIKGDQLPGGVDFSVMDFGVNSGTGRSARYLQAVVGAAQDGVIGPKTLEAVAKRDPVDVVKRHCAKRLGFLQALTNWATFGRGWLRRVTEVEALAVRWAAEDRGKTTHEVHQELRKEEIKAKDASNAQGVGAGGSGAAGTGTGAATGPDVTTLNTSDIVSMGVVVLFIALAAWLFVRFVINRDRSKAYAEAVSQNIEDRNGNVA